MGLRNVLISLLMSVVWMQNGVIGVLEISSEPPYAVVGSDVNITCDNTDLSDRNEIQWRRSRPTDGFTDVQDAQKIVDTKLTDPPSPLVYSGGINESHFIPSNKGTEYILTIKDFNTTENDVYRYWCRFFLVPELIPDAVASMEIDLGVGSDMDKMEISSGGNPVANQSTIEIDKEGATLTFRVNGTRPHAQILYNVSNPEVNLMPGDLVVTTNAMDSTLMDSRRDVTVNMNNVDEARLTCNVYTKQDTPDVVWIFTIKQSGPACPGWCIGLYIGGGLVLVGVIIITAALIYRKRKQKKSKY